MNSHFSWNCFYLKDTPSPTKPKRLWHCQEKNPRGSGGLRSPIPCCSSAAPSPAALRLPPCRAHSGLTQCLRPQPSLLPSRETHRTLPRTWPFLLSFLDGDILCLESQKAQRGGWCKLPSFPLLPGYREPFLPLDVNPFCRSLPRNGIGRIFTLVHKFFNSVFSHAMRSPWTFWRSLIYLSRGILCHQKHMRAHTHSYIYTTHVHTLHAHPHITHVYMHIYTHHTHACACPQCIHRHTHMSFIPPASLHNGSLVFSNLFTV